MKKTIKEVVELTSSCYASIYNLVKENKVNYVKERNKIYIQVESLIEKFPHVQLIIEQDKEIESLKVQLKNWKRKASKK